MIEYYQQISYDPVKTALTFRIVFSKLRTIWQSRLLVFRFLIEPSFGQRFLVVKFFCLNRPQHFPLFDNCWCPFDLICAFKTNCCSWLIAFEQVLQNNFLPSTLKHSFSFFLALSWAVIVDTCHRLTAAFLFPWNWLFAVFENDRVVFSG